MSKYKVGDVLKVNGKLYKLEVDAKGYVLVSLDEAKTVIKTTISELFQDKAEVENFDKELIWVI